MFPCCVIAKCRFSVSNGNTLRLSADLGTVGSFPSGLTKGLVQEIDRSTVGLNKWCRSAGQWEPEEAHRCYSVRSVPNSAAGCDFITGLTGPVCECVCTQRVRSEKLTVVAEAQGCRHERGLMLRGSGENFNSVECLISKFYACCMSWFSTFLFLDETLFVRSTGEFHYSGTENAKHHFTN